MLFVIILISFICLLLAGIWDLLTTEVPDEIPAVMIISGLVLWFFYGVITNDFSNLFYSLVIGSVLLGIGLILYHKGQWGGADAWLLAAIGYMIPFYNGQIFITGYLLNFLIVSSVYTIFYVLFLGLKNRSLVFSEFNKDMRKNWKFLPMPLVVAAIFLIINTTILVVYSYLLILIFLIVIFWRYAQIIEKDVLKRRISSKNLKEGDVIDGMKWVGLTMDEIKDIQKTKKHVVIKEGLRFVPVFFITLIITLFYGNIFYLIMGF